MKVSNSSPRRFRECGVMGVPAKETPVIQGCKILGFKSSNGRQYLTEAVQKAIHLYEGKTVFIDHASDPDKPRGFLERFGKIRNVRMGPDGAYGDLHYNPRHTLAETFLGWVEVDPESVGFSHDAVGSVREESDGTLTITEILEVNSVDLVAVPATTKGLFETHMNDDDLMMEDDVAPDEAPIDEPGPAEEGDHAEHLAQAVMSIFKSDMTTEEKKKKILDLLKVMDDPAPKQEADGDEEEEEVQEMEDEEEKEKAEEAWKSSVSKFMADVTKQLKTLTEALPSLHAKAPKSLPPAKKTDKKPLTVDDLIASLS